METIKSGAAALLNVIPYAGGAVASIIGDFATQRRFEKVCEVLSDLNSRLENDGANPERYLSKDQIVEVVHETLQAATTASDEQKVAALKNGLGYAFLSADPFERKQLFLQVLRPCTSIELPLLSQVYRDSDPYLVYEGGPQLSSNQDAVIVAAHSGIWVPGSNRDECGQPPLLSYLAERSSFSAGDIEGAARLLDGKGLTTLSSNLRRRDCKVLKWRSPLGMTTVVQSGSFNALVGGAVADTPVEASRTKFGEDFLRFFKGY